MNYRSVDADAMVISSCLQTRVVKRVVCKLIYLSQFVPMPSIDTGARGSSVLSCRRKVPARRSTLVSLKKRCRLAACQYQCTRAGHLAGVLLDLSATAQINDSLALGKVVLKEIGGIRRLHKGNVEQAGFSI